MAAADAMIHATAGLTVLEAHIRGCPVVSYGFSAGHLRANNAAFERFGLAEVARSEHELESVLRHVTRERRSPDSSFASLPSIASRALTCGPRVQPQPVWRLRTERVAAAVASPRCCWSWCSRWSTARARPRPRSRSRTDPHRQGQRHARPSRRPARRPVEPVAHREAAERRLLDRGGAAARPGAAAAVVHAGPALAPVVPRLGGRARGRAAPRGGGRRRAHLRRRPAPAGHAGGPGDPARGGAPRDLLPRRRAGRAAAGAGRRDRRRRPPGRAALPPPPQPAAARRRASCSTTPSGPGRRSRRRAARRSPTTGRPTGSSAPSVCARSAAAAGGRSSGRSGGGTGSAAPRRRRSRVGRPPASAAGDILLLHDADYYSARGSWVRTAAALPMILEELEARGLKSRLLRR